MSERTLKLSDSETLRFLELYEMEPILYNPTLDEYRDRNLRAAAARRICDTLNIPGFGSKEVIVKFKNLRSSYCQELKKIADSQRSGKSADDIYKPKVVWFGKMNAFIRPYVQQRDTLTNPITSEPEDVPVSNPVPQTVTTTSYENTNIIEEVRKGWKRKRTSVQEKNTDTMSAVCRQVDKYPAPHNPKEPDEHDLFCLSIAPKLRAMDKKQRILTEKIISDALYLGQMGYLNPAVHINIPSQNMSASPISTVQSQPSPSTTLIIKPEYEGQSDCDDDY